VGVRLYAENRMSEPSAFHGRIAFESLDLGADGSTGASDSAESPVSAPAKPLHRNANGNSNPGIPAVIHVVPVVDVRNIDVIGVVPVICPGSRPWVNETNPITLVLETRISTNHQERKPVDSEPMLRPKVSMVSVVRDAIAAVAATLLPGAVV